MWNIIVHVSFLFGIGPYANYIHTYELTLFTVIKTGLTNIPKLPEDVRWGVQFNRSRVLWNSSWLFWHLSKLDLIKSFTNVINAITRALLRFENVYLEYFKRFLWNISFSSIMVLRNPTIGTKIVLIEFYSRDFCFLHISWAQYFYLSNDM